MLLCRGLVVICVACITYNVYKKSCDYSKRVMNYKIYEMCIKYLGEQKKVLCIKYTRDIHSKHNKHNKHIYGLPKIKLTIPKNISKPVYIDCSCIQNYILPSLPNNLIKLDLSNCGLTEIPNHLPPSLEYLKCDRNKITIIDKLPKNLRKLICSHNVIEQILNIPKTMEHIDMSHNHISELDNLPDTIKYINCSNNRLKYIINIPIMAQHFDCSCNEITIMPNTIPLTLVYLNCSNNYYIKSLPNNLQNLRKLYCQNNSISKLPIDFQKLENFELANNKIIKLDIDVSDSINKIGFGFNGIKYIAPKLWIHYDKIITKRKYQKFVKGANDAIYKWKNNRLFMANILTINQLYNKYNIPLDICKIIVLYY